MPNDPFELAINTMNNSKKYSNVDRQKEGRKELATWLADHHQCMTHTNDGSLSTKKMLELLKALSKLLFLADFPLPASHADLTFAWSLCLAKDVGAYGRTSHRLEKGNPRVHIEIDPKDYNRELDLDSYVAYVCSICLLELCHAYLMTWCCQGQHTGSGNCTREDKVIWYPGDGHCTAWFHLACYSQNLLEAVLKGPGFLDLQFKPNLSVMSSYLKGLREGEKLMPAQEWNRFFRDWTGAVSLFSDLTGKQADEFSGYLERDAHVMQVWIEAGEKQMRQEVARDRQAQEAFARRVEALEMR